MQASPLDQMIERFGDNKESNRKEARKQAKDALVKAVRACTKKNGLLEEDFSEKGLERVSNRKLLRLLAISDKVEKEFGSRSGLIDQVLELEQRQKDGGFREHLEKLSLPRLVDFYQAARKRASAN